MGFRQPLPITRGKAGSTCRLDDASHRIIRQADGGAARACSETAELPITTAHHLEHLIHMLSPIIETASSYFKAGYMKYSESIHKSTDTITTTTFK
jgi:hypothetical protein